MSKDLFSFYSKLFYVIILYSHIITTPPLLYGIYQIIKVGRIYGVILWSMYYTRHIQFEYHKNVLQALKNQNGIQIPSLLPHFYCIRFLTLV